MDGGRARAVARALGGAAREWSRLTRAGDWWLYHLLPLLAPTYAAVAHFGVPAPRAYPLLARLVVSIVCVAAYAHLVNDLADAEQDARAGKRPPPSAGDARRRAALSAALLAGGFGVWAGAGLAPWLIALLALIAALQPAYALRPIRIKERGAWGLLADALHTHALPTLFCVALFADPAGDALRRPFALAATVWSLLVGLRGILYHQRLDEANDRRAGVRTFVTLHGSARAARLARRVVFPAELVALGVLGASLLPTSPAIVLAFAAYGASMLSLRRLGCWRTSFDDPAPGSAASYLPMLAFYRSWPAFAFALLLAARDRRYVALATIHGVLFARPILRLAWDFAFYTHLFVRGVARRLLRGPA